jgi:hypothetical protein
MTEGSRPTCTVPELEAVLGKTHRTAFEGGRLETWVMVGRGTRSAIERAESGNSQPKTARASALPDRQRRASRGAGQTDGRALESTNRHSPTAAPGGAGRPRSGPGVPDPGLPE